MVGAVSESGLYKTGTWAAANAGLIDGLTDYDSCLLYTSDAADD